MKLDTIRFGELEIKEEDIIEFPEGILGFEDMKKFVIFQMEEGSPLMWMQSVEEAALAFIVIKPFEFRPDYSIDLSDKDVEFLKIEKPEDVQLLSIVVVPEDPAKMTANLQGPIVINAKKNIAKQIISNNPKHKLKHYILQEMEELQKKAQGGEK